MTLWVNPANVILAEVSDTSRGNAQLKEARVEKEGKEEKDMRLLRVEANVEDMRQLRVEAKVEKEAKEVKAKELGITIRASGTKEFATIAVLWVTKRQNADARE